MAIANSIFKPQLSLKRHPLKKGGFWTLLLAMVAAFFTIFPVSAAERVYLKYGILKFSVSVRALETFAKEGIIESELLPYLRHFTPQQQNQFRELLQMRYDVNVVTVSRFSNTGPAQRLLDATGEILQRESGENGAIAIRAAMVLAASDPEGVTPLNFLRKFPANLQIDIGKVFKLVDRISDLMEETEKFVDDLKNLASQQATTETPLDFEKLADLRELGEFKTTQQTLDLYDSKRDRRFGVDLYFPIKAEGMEIPVLVISNGAGADRDRFTHLAKHLASYGFAVAIPDHPGSNEKRKHQFYAGLYPENFDATDFIDRPLDVTYLLDRLEQMNVTEFRGQLNLNKVGVFGYSFGGSTALALAGAKLNFKHLEQTCGSEMNLLNISQLYQCRALELPKKTYHLKDNRVRAVFVFVPFSNALFGEAELSQINIPVFWQSTEEDLLTPLLLEQMPAFKGLTTSERYLAISEGIPHANVTFTPMNQDLYDRIKTILKSYYKAMSVAFFKVYVAGENDYQAYLQSSYAQAIAEDPYNLSVIPYLNLTGKSSELNPVEE